jgi:hypothetical protein
MLTGSLSLLTACGVSTAADIARPTGPLAEPCAQPVALPIRALTQAQVEILWGRDRAALRNCAEMHSLLIDFIDAQAGANAQRNR